MLSLSRITMSKKCVMCGAPASYVIKSSSDYYCSDCTHELFAHPEYLQRIDDAAKILKAQIKAKLQETPQDLMKNVDDDNE